MAIINKPADYDASTTDAAATFNTLKNTIYDEFNGNIDDANIKSGAAIAPAKIADTAAVLTNLVGAGMQTISRPTKFGDGAFWLHPTLDTTNAIVTVAAGAVTAAIPAGYNVVMLSHVSSGAAATIATLTGGTVGQVVKIVIRSVTGGANGITLTNTAATSTTADVVKGLNGETWSANAGGGATSYGIGPTLVYGDLLGLGVNQWYQI